MTQPLQYTYATLIAKIEAEAEDNDPEFLAELQNFVSEGELRVVRDLDLEMFEQWLDVTINSGTREVSKPTDVISIYDIHIRTGGSASKWNHVERRGFDYVLMYAPTEDTQAMPRFFCELSASDVYVVPTPDITYSGGNAKARCLIRPSRLDATNTTSWLSEHVPDLLFHACMIPAYRFLKHTAKVNESAELYASLIAPVKIELEELRRRRYKQLNTGSQGADD